MLPTEIRALTVLTFNSVDAKTLAERINSSYTRTTEIIKLLEKKKFIQKNNGQIKLADTIHATLFKKNVGKYDLTKLLGGKAEDVAIVLLTRSEIRSIQKKTMLSYRTLRRTLSKMMETGAIKRDGKTLELVDDRDLRLFITSLWDMKNSETLEPYAEAIPTLSGIQIKQVPAGKPAEGFPTAFSAFHRYGIELRTTHDYYVSKQASIEDILVHALAVSTTPIEMTDCAVFLAKNLERVDLGIARRKAREFGVGSLLLDTENYIRNLTLNAPEKFLPWNEYTEKARLYGIDPESLLPRSAYPDFFKLFSEKLETPVEIYVFGGEAMRFRDLKRATKDVDIAIHDNTSFELIKNALIKLGYEELGEDALAYTDTRLNPSGIFVKEKLPRIDIFTKSICRKFNLTESMLSRAEHIQIGKLSIRIASSEDLLLLKSVTDREGDIQDMITLARSRGFRWNIVLQELIQQEDSMSKRFCIDVLDSLEAVEEKTGIRAPIHNKLERHCLDESIIQLLEHSSPLSMKKIREYINYPEYRIASRLRNLIKEHRVKQSADKKFILIS